LKRVLLVSQTDAGFHSKLTKKTQEAFNGWKVSTITPPVCHFASYTNKVHYIRLIDPMTLWKEIYFCRELDASLAPISFTLLGLSEILRDSHKKAAVHELEKFDCIDRIFVFTIHPESLKAHCKEINFLQSDKVVFLHEPPYEETSFYRSSTYLSARTALFANEIPIDASVVLYFGTYFFSKGPDLLLEVAKQLPRVHFFFVGDTKLGSITINKADFADFYNIHFVDRYVSDEEASLWFQATDLVALPYRKFYEHDTSGIFNQAMQARRPVIMPNFSPFSNLFAELGNGVGKIFIPEDTESLKYQIEVFFKCNLWPGNVFDEYLSKIEGWNCIGELV